MCVVHYAARRYKAHVNVKRGSTLETLGSEGNNDLRGASLAATSSACEVCPFLGFAIGFVAGAGEAVTTLLTCLHTSGRLSLMTG